MIFFLCPDLCFALVLLFGCLNITLSNLIWRTRWNIVWIYASIWEKAQENIKKREAITKKTWKERWDKLSVTFKVGRADFFTASWLLVREATLDAGHHLVVISYAPWCLTKLLKMRKAIDIVFFLFFFFWHGNTVQFSTTIWPPVFVTAKPRPKSTHFSTPRTRIGPDIRQPTDNFTKCRFSKRNYENSLIIKVTFTVGLLGFSVQSTHQNLGVYSIKQCLLPLTESN